MPRTVSIVQLDTTNNQRLMCAPYAILLASLAFQTQPVFPVFMGLHLTVVQIHRAELANLVLSSTTTALAVIIRILLYCAGSVLLGIILMSRIQHANNAQNLVLPVR